MKFINVYMLYLLNVCAEAYQVEILTTSTEASSLDGWKKETIINGSKVVNSSIHIGWDEVSVFFGNTTPRGFEICPDTQEEKSRDIQSWLRSPYLNVTGVSRVYVDLQFWMRECQDLEDTICRETFKVYYRLNKEKESVANQVDLNDYEFIKVDTVAAEVRFNEAPETQKKINHEMVSIPIPTTPEHKAMYIAIVDEGACISLVSTKVYYVVCPAITNKLANFRATHTGQNDTSLVEVRGYCVANSVPLTDPASPDHPGPLYRCTSSGEWKVRTGSCECLPGYQPNSARTMCSPCPVNFYKSSSGNKPCTPCPANSFSPRPGSTGCRCEGAGGGLLAQGSPMVPGAPPPHHDCEVCATLPSAPIQLTVTPIAKQPGTVELAWKEPLSFGRCRKVSYCVLCQACPLSTSTSNVSATTLQPALSSASSTSSASLTASTTSQSSRTNCSARHSQDQTSRQYCSNLSFHPRRCQERPHPLTVSGLRGHSSYTFTVVAFNGATFERHPNATNLVRNQANLNGPNIPGALLREFSDLLSASGSSATLTTGETLPSVVTGVKMTSHNTTSVMLRWDRPRYANGPTVEYQVLWSKSSELGKAPYSPRVLQDREASNATSNSNDIVIARLEAGTQYSLTIRARNAAGYGDLSPLVLFSTLPDAPSSSVVTESQDPSSPAIAHPYLIAAAAVLFILVATLVVLWFKCAGGSRDKKPLHDQQDAPRENGLAPHMEHLTAHTVIPDQRTYVDPFSLGPMLPHEFECETLPSLVTTHKVIGCGEFGEVYQGTLTRIGSGDCTTEPIKVAIKQLHAQCEPHEQLDFLREAMALERFQHPNVVRLEAVVMRSRPFMIVTELMDHGCLEAFLRAHREAHKAFPAVALVRMMLGVARGMAYLNSLQYVHRDLAARNVLINSDLVCKVADFGLTRHMGERESDSDCSCPTYTTQGGKIAIRWTSPEAVAFRAYSQASDVWSFGVFAWEVNTYGEKPYWDLTNQQVLQAVNEGFRLPAPEDCPSVLHQLMVSCWQRDRHARPTFDQLVTSLESLIDDPESLLVLASPASTGAEEMFFCDSDPSTPIPVPTLTQGNSRHNYTTCQRDQSDTDDRDVMDDVGIARSTTWGSNRVLAKPLCDVTESTAFLAPPTAMRRHADSSTTAGSQSPLLAGDLMTSSLSSQYAASLV